jgi:hypothetical protein
LWKSLGFEIFFYFVVVKVFSGHEELLKSELCDVIVVSSPNMTHHQILMDIINYSKPHHVLVEKPLCTTVADCKQVFFLFFSVWYQIDQFIQLCLESGFGGCKEKVRYGGASWVGVQIHAASC